MVWIHSLTCQLGFCGFIHFLGTRWRTVWCCSRSYALKSEFLLILGPSFMFSIMDPSFRHRRLIIRGAAMVVVMTAWVFLRFRRMLASRRGITYGPMSVRDQERATNLRFIHHSEDTSCVELLRMKKAPFFSCTVTCFVVGVFSRIASIVKLKSSWQCFF